MPKKSAEQKLLELIEEKGCEWIQSQLKIAKLVEKKWRGEVVKTAGLVQPEHTWVVTGDEAKNDLGLAPSATHGKGPCSAGIPD